MKKGFTLIELLIVITIIGILAVAFLPSVLGAPAKARDTQRIATVQKIASVLTTATISGKLTSGGCVGPAADNTTIVDSDLIKAEDFGGKYPADPQTSNALPSNTCLGGYLVQAGGGVDNAYAFAVYSQLEDATQGNFNCASIPGGESPTTTGTAILPNTLTIEPGAGECYAVLVQ